MIIEIAITSLHLLSTDRLELLAANLPLFGHYDIVGRLCDGRDDGNYHYINSCTWNYN